jgi:ferredoxin, 2Fe-2S
MPTITLIHADGREQALDVAVGATIMHAAVAAGVDGIVGQCGGSAMCATCHVYVSPDQAQAASLPEVSAVEDAMLDSTASERRKESRLSCQLQATDGFEGLVVQLPDSQL